MGFWCPVSPPFGYVICGTNWVVRWCALKLATRCVGSGVSWGGALMQAKVRHCLYLAWGQPGMKKGTLGSWENGSLGGGILYLNEDSPHLASLCPKSCGSQGNMPQLCQRTLMENVSEGGGNDFKC